jgi:multicomponent Na+:H+ antiporter subunit F
MTWIDATGPVSVMVYISLGLLSVGMLLAMYRLILGPSLPDRVIALDVIALLAVGMIAVHSIADGQPVFLRAATVLALISFLGTVAFARYLERRALK